MSTHVKTNGRSKAVETRAAGVLKDVLAQISGVRVREIRLEPYHLGPNREIVASIDVFGHRQTLACAVTTGTTVARIREAISELRNELSPEQEAIMPVLIAPSLRSSARAVYTGGKIGFLDFHGNAHLDLGETFIWMRSLPSRQAQDGEMVSTRT